MASDERNIFCAIRGSVPVGKLKPMPHDSELLCAYSRSGDQAAFSDFVRRHIDLVYAAAYRQVGKDPHLAEDITQEVFATVARKAEKLASHPVLPAWLHQTTRFIAIDFVRRRSRRQNRESEL